MTDPNRQHIMDVLRDEGLLLPGEADRCASCAASSVPFSWQVPFTRGQERRQVHVPCCAGCMARLDLTPDWAGKAGAVLALAGLLTSVWLVVRSGRSFGQSIRPIVLYGVGLAILGGALGGALGRLVDRVRSKDQKRRRDEATAKWPPTRRLEERGWTR